MMNFREFFKRSPRPSTEGLQSVAEKYVKPLELKFPPVDENGRYVDDRPNARKAGQPAGGGPSGMPRDADR